MNRINPGQPRRSQRSRRAPEQLTHPSEVELGSTGSAGSGGEASFGINSDPDSPGAGRTTHVEYRLRVLVLLAILAAVLVLGVALADGWAQALVLALVVAAVGAVGLAALWIQRYPEQARMQGREFRERLSGRG